MSKYMDPTTDFGFKKLFGEPANKDLTASLITDVLELQTPLLEVRLLDKEQLPDSEEERAGIYDLYCHDAGGNHFLVEMQKSRLAYVKDRMLYYSTFPIASQAKKGRDRYSYFDIAYQPDKVRDVAVMTFGGKKVVSGWDYYLDAVYCIAILDYALNGSRTAVNRNSIRNDEPPHDLFYDKLRFVTIELPLFDEHKPEYSLDAHLHKWLYFLKYLPIFEEVPMIFQDDIIFRKAFKIAEIANFTPRERRAYYHSLKRSWDSYAVFKTSYETGQTKGETIGKVRGKKIGKRIGKRIGKKEGLIEGEINALLIILKQQLGPIPPEVEQAIRALNNLEQINAILSSIFKIKDGETLKNYL